MKAPHAETHDGKKKMASSVNNKQYRISKAQGITGKYSQEKGRLLRDGTGQIC